MANTDNLVKKWGALNLSTNRVAGMAIELNNSLNAFSHADFISKRLSYMETLHNLTHAACDVFECFAGKTTKAAFDTELALRAGAPARVFHMSITDEINGGTHVYYWSDQVVSGVDTLYQRPLFTGHIDAHPWTLNRLTLKLSGTEKADHKRIPENIVSINAWPRSVIAAEGAPYPEVYGAPGNPLDAAKIGDGFGAAPTVLVDAAALQYVVAGHALTKVSGVTSGEVALWVRISGYREGYAYIEECTFALSGTDADGNAIATVTLPAVVLAVLYMPTIHTGIYFSSTATNPTNATGRDAATNATLAPGQILQLALQGGLAASGRVYRIHIATDNTSADLRVRWTGPQSTTVVGGTASGPRIDNRNGWDITGKVEISDIVYTYTGITEISASVYQLDVSAYGGPTGGGLAATMVGDWVTVSGTDMEVTDQRDWSESDFTKFELEMENTSGVTTHNVAFLGLRIQLELGAHPEIMVPCEGVNVNFRSTDYGAAASPVNIIEDLHTRLLGLPEARIGTTFDSALSLLNNWKFAVSLDRQLDSQEFLRDLARQAKAFLWRDGSNAVNMGVYRLGDASSLTLTEAGDIEDPRGGGFRVSFTDPEEIYNRVRVKFAPDLAAAEFTKEYFITETGSYPADTAREAEATNSQAVFGVTNQLTIEAPFIQDDDTALALLQFKFDFHRIRRKRITFRVPMHVKVEAGDIIALTHQLLDDDLNYLVEEITRASDSKEIRAVSISVEGVFEDAIGYEIKASAVAEHRWGSPQYWDNWENTSAGSIAEATGRVDDYGLALFAERQFKNTVEKPTHGAHGSGSDALSATDLSLGGQNGARAALETPSRSAAEVTWVHRHTAYGAAETVREVGIFSALTGSKMLGRTLFPANFILAQDAHLIVTEKITLKEPTAGSAVTTYGRNLIANRMYQDTAEKPTHIAIGTGGTAEAEADVALAAQISARVAFSLAYPKHFGLSSIFNSLFAAATYAPNTVREFGIFTAGSGNNAILRKVPADPTVLGAADDLTASMKLTAAHHV